MNKFTFFFIMVAFTTHVSCQSQSSNPFNTTKLVGGGCDGCELMYVDMPTQINSVDTSAGWTENGQKLLITGTVYNLDGRTPAPGVIIYYWQTDNNGYYSPAAGLHDKAKRHGHIRGWVKSDENGNYKLYTIRPAPYPGDDIPAHIHTAIKEPDIKDEYYIDEFVFDDDKLLSGKKRKALENRGGSGVLRVLLKDSLQVAEHNIILGLHIPNYPKKENAVSRSGLSIGVDQPSFTPFHAFGPDKGTRTCPVCKYGRFHGIIYFVGNRTNWADTKKWLAFLEQESIARSKYLKAYFVYGNEGQYEKVQRQIELEKIGTELGLKNIALTFVPSLDDKESEVHLNKINPQVENTFVVFKNSTIVEKFINLYANADNFKKISLTLDRTKGNYFNLLQPQHAD